VGGAAGQVVSTVIRHLTWAELEAGLDDIYQSPRDEGVLELIVRRPAVGQRELLQTAQLDTVEGLVGDNWSRRRSPMTADGAPHPGMQLNLMSTRAASLVAQSKERWPLAGDQLFVDLDLSVENLPPGTRLDIGTATIEVSDQPHTGCGKFVSRFGVDAMKFVNSPLGRRLNLRGINAVVVRGGEISVGDTVRKSRHPSMTLDVASGGDGGNG
jgi:hypothetical protein